MTTMKVLRTACGIAAAVALAAGVALAQPNDKRTVFTFNRPISLPGVTLPAGKSMFRLVDTETTRKVVQVLSENGKTPYTMLHTIPDIRRDASGTPEVKVPGNRQGSAIGCEDLVVSTGTDRLRVHLSEGAGSPAGAGHYGAGVDHS